jgi:hypothetical protein
MIYHSIYVAYINICIGNIIFHYDSITSKKYNKVTCLIKKKCLMVEDL